MERSSKLMTFAAVLYFLSLLVHGLVPETYVNGTPSTTGALRGLSSGRLASKQPFAGAAASQLRLVAAGLAVSAACMSLQAGRGKARVQAKAGPSAQMFASALITAAEKNDESLEVAKDMLSIKTKLEGTDAESIMAVLSGAPKMMTRDEALRARTASSQLATMAASEGKGMLEVMDEVFKPARAGTAANVDTMTTVKKLLPGMESQTLDKFLSYVNKKDALSQLPEVCTAYTKMLYTKESVAPVLVRSAQPLSEAQEEKIKSKMLAKLGVQEIKLVTRVEASLIAGLQIEWDFADPVNYVDPKGQEDISFSRAIERAVMAKTGQETLE